jgi:hypothetical protein
MSSLDRLIFAPTACMQRYSLCLLERERVLGKVCHGDLFCCSAPGRLTMLRCSSHCQARLAELLIPKVKPWGSCEVVCKDGTHKKLSK